MVTTAQSARGAIAQRGADSTARLALLLAGGFLLLAIGLQTLAAIKLAYPSFLSGIGSFSYGRMQPMANAATLFGWLTFSNLSITYFLLPRLTGSKLWNEPLALLGTLATAAVTLVAIVGVGLGLTDGRPLADFHVIADAILLASYLVPLLVAIQTIRNRTETSTYVSLYYVLGGLVWLIGSVIVGNLPSTASVGGIVQNQFYASTILTQWAIGVGVGAAYYIIPKVTGRPLFSRSLAMIGFWSLIITNLWAGPANLVFGPTGDWAESIGVVFAFSLVVPAIAVLVNLVGTMEGSWDMFRTRVDVRFAILGAVAAVFVAFLAGVQGFRSVSAILGLTTFVVGTQYAMLWGVGGLFAAAFAYHALPRLTGRGLFSDHFGRMHGRLILFGVFVAAGSFWLAGLASGYTWLAGAYAGETTIAGEGFAATTDAVSGLYALGLLGTLIVAAASALHLYTLWRTYTSGQAIAAETLVMVAGEEVAE